MAAPDSGNKTVTPSRGDRTTYTKDVDYTSRFGVLQTPIHMVIAAGMGGWQGPDPAAPFTYYDIACGNGETLVLLAAAYPHGRFIGVDFNASHVASARIKIDEAELSNAEVVEADILDLLELLPESFDFAAVAGAYSWLDESRRAALRKFFSERAKMNALVMLDYAAQPGSTAADALYRILRHRADSHSGNSAQRLHHAARSLIEDAQAGALFFQHYPTARRRLDDLLDHNPADEAHEVFNHDRGLWFDDVAADMTESGLVWANNASLKRTIPEAVLPATLAARTAVEDQSAMDLALDTAYRADIFVAHHAPKVGAARALAGRPLIDPSGTVKRRLTSTRNRYPQWSGDALESAIKAITSGATTVDEMGIDDVTLTRLLAVSAIQLGIETVRAPDNQQAPQFTISGAYNVRVLENDIGVLEPRPFACPVAGTSLVLPLIDRVALFVLCGGSPGRAYDKVKAAGIDTDAAFGSGRPQFTDTCNRLAAAFSDRSAPILCALGVLRQAS